MGSLIGRGTGRIGIGVGVIGPGLCAGLVASRTALTAPDPLAQSSSVFPTGSAAPNQELMAPAVLGRLSLSVTTD